MSKLVGTNICSIIIDLLILIISGWCLQQIELASHFSVIIISAWVSLLLMAVATYCAVKES